MTDFIRVSNLFNGCNIGLKINMTTDSVDYDVLQFQPCNELNYLAETGIICNNEDYNAKVKSFIKNARKRNSALVITPEGSIPYEIIHDVINDVSKWPEEGNLWCLCSEGMSIETYKSSVAKINKKENIRIIVDDSITYKKHINALWYLFRISPNELCVLIQLKQKPMSDRDLSREATDLSLGSKVYIFDLNKGQNTKNLLLSLICADAIQLSSSDVITSLRHSYPILINPQLNPKPFSNHFVGFRKSYFSDTTISKQRLITANWGKGTVLGSININQSGSSYYNYLSVNGKRHIEAISKDRDIFKHRNQCQKLGMTNFCEDTYNIWNIGSEECFTHYYIRKEEVYELNSDLGMQLDPNSKGKHFFDVLSKGWNLQEFHNCMLPSIDLVFSDLHEEYYDYLPINYNKCIDKTCSSECEWLHNDFLFGISFGTLLRGEIQSNNEISNRTTVSLNNESLDNTKKKRKQFVRLVKLLSDNKFPKSLGMFDDNNKLEIDLDAARTGSDRIYNVSVRAENEEYPNWKDKKGLFIILDTDEISEVEMLYDKVKKMVNREYRDQIVIYYRNDIEYVCYSRPYENIKIGKSNNHFSNKTSSFFEGSMSYE